MRWSHYLSSYLDVKTFSRNPIARVLIYSNFDDLNKKSVLVFDPSGEFYKFIFVAEKNGVLHYCRDHNNKKITLNELKKLNIKEFSYLERETRFYE